MKRILLTLAAFAVLTPCLASAQMPDARQMSGVPLPVPDLAPGTVTVRVVRGNHHEHHSEPGRRALRRAVA